MPFFAFVEWPAWLLAVLPPLAALVVGYLLKWGLDWLLTKIRVPAEVRAVIDGAMPWVDRQIDLARGTPTPWDDVALDIAKKLLIDVRDAAGKAGVEVSPVITKIVQAKVAKRVYAASVPSGTDKTPNGAVKVRLIQ